MPERRPLPPWLSDPRTLLVLAAFLGVVIALVSVDFATGGKAELTDLGVATPVTPLPTAPPSPTLPPGVTPSPVPTPTVDASAAVRNQQRKQDLLQIAAAFIKYAQDHGGSFPDTKDALQSICVYEELDLGCAIKQYLDPIPADPIQPKDPLKNGYWWSSSGKKLVLYAINEGGTDDSPECPARQPTLQKIKDAITCVVVQAP